ncbi:P-loop containing nucleoside triphosphate hydrolase protein [Aspergillus varians]
MAETKDLEHVKPSQTDPALLEKLDKLFACNVGDYVSLPQLIAVGGQSSGKGSVLEGLTGLPFPRDSTICTRFATQIIFRRATAQASRRIRASIKSAPQSTPECVARLKAWTRSEATTLEPKAFLDMIHEAHTVMGSGSLEDQSKSTFSRHVLRLEISGPNEDHLAVIDVPGIFKSITPGVTTEYDVEMVCSMVQEYMKDPRSVIVAVVPASVSASTQEVIKRAREVDPEGQRTLGVLTMPDGVDRGADHQVLDLVTGKPIPLRHGWVVVRNIRKSELASGDKSREGLEEDPRRRNGSGLIPQDKSGIQSLRKRLQETVIENARREFPMVRLDINKKLKETRAALYAIGQERANRSQQVDFLLGIVARFQEIVGNALRGNYGADEIFSKVQRFRLATTVIDRNEQFKSDMIQIGHVYRFRSDAEASHPAPTLRIPKHTSHLHEPQVSTRKIESGLELKDTLTSPELLSPPVDDDIFRWLESEYLTSRGFELGTFSASLLPSVMKQQATKWESIALGYISDIIAVVNGFIASVLTDLCGDERISRGLVSVMTDGLHTKYSKAVQHTRFLLENERSDTLISLHQSFTDTLQSRPEMKMQKFITDKSVHSVNGALGKVVRVDDIKAAMPGLTNVECMVRQVHDILQSYYQVAQARFIDSVCMQSSNYYLLSGPKSPMKLLSPMFVYRLSDQELEDIAGEDPAIHRQRQQLSNEIEALELARKILS